MNTLNILVIPSIFIFSLALGGCSREQVVEIPPGGAYLSTSAGATFEQAVSANVAGDTIAGFDLGKIHRALFDPNIVFMAAGTEGMVLSMDDAETWEILPTTLTTTIDVSYLRSGILLATGVDENGQGSVVRSLDRGKTWQNVFTMPLQVEQKRFQIISGGTRVPVSIVSLELDPRVEDRVWAGTNDGTIFTAESSGQLWKTVTELASSSQIITGDRFDAGIVSMEVSSTREDEIFVVTQKKQLIRIQGEEQFLIRVPETTSGASPFGVLLEERNILDVSFVPGFPNALLIGTEKGAVITRDGGETYIELRLPIDASKIVSRMVVAVSPTNANRIVIAADGIIYRSEDGGQAWHTTSIGPVGFTITDLSINPKNASRVLAILKAIVT